MKSLELREERINTHLEHAWKLHKQLWGSSQRLDMVKRVIDNHIEQVELFASASNDELYYYYKDLITRHQIVIQRYPDHSSSTKETIKLYAQDIRKLLF